MAFCFALTGCSSLSGISTIHKSAKGSVQLQEVVDWSFEASHPVIIDYMTMAKIVKGVLADETTPVGNKMPARGSKPMRAFSDEDAEFLAPLLAQGLSQAKPEQMVGFTVSSSAGSGAEPTAGTLYVQGGSIYLTIAASQGMKAFAFSPSTAARLEKTPRFVATGVPNAMSFVIDVQALVKTPSNAPAAASKSPVVPSAQAPTNSKANGQPAAPANALAVGYAAAAEAEASSAQMSLDEILSKKLDELRQARESNVQKESEIKILRREAEWMKQKLKERTEELKAMRANKVSSQPTPKKKKAEAYPTR